MVIVMHVVNGTGKWKDLPFITPYGKLLGVNVENHRYEYHTIWKNIRCKYGKL